MDLCQVVSSLLIPLHYVYWQLWYGGALTHLLSEAFGNVLSPKPLFVVDSWAGPRLTDGWRYTSRLGPLCLGNPLSKCL